MSQLRIYFSAHWRDASSSCAWALCDDSGALLQSGNDPLSALPKSRDCIAILAPDRVLSLTTKPPAGARRRWQSALPFMAEEHTLSDPEDSHVVPGKLQADGQLPLAVMDKTWLRRITEACRQARLPLRSIWPESWLPALSPNTSTLVWDGSTGFIKTAAAQSFALDNGDAHTPPVALQLALKANTTSRKIELRWNQHGMTCEPALPHWEGLEWVSGSLWDWRTAPLPADLPNLLWGEFAPRVRLDNWWLKLRPLGMIVLVALTLEIVGTNVQWAMLSQEKRQLQQDMERTFHAAFGESSTVVNAPVQMQRKLAELHHQTGLADKSDFLPLLDAAAHSLSGLPAGSVQAMHYEAGRLDVDIKLARSSDFTTLKQHLNADGLSLRMGDIHDTGSSADARVSLFAEEAP